MHAPVTGITDNDEDDRTGPVVSFACRSRELVRQFADFARGAIPGCVVEEDTRTPKAYCVIHSVTLRGSDCVEMARVLYGDGEIALPRKRGVAFDMLRAHGVVVEEAPADDSVLGDAVKDKIFSLNAFELLGLNKADFAR